MVLLFYVIIGFIFLVAVGQRRNYVLVNSVKEYFRINNVDHILVCADVQQEELLANREEVRKYERLAIVNMTDLESREQFKLARLLKRAVRMAGVMQYPCWLTLEDNELKGKYFNP